MKLRSRALYVAALLLWTWAGCFWWAARNPDVQPGAYVHEGWR